MSESTSAQPASAASRIASPNGLMPIMTGSRITGFMTYRCQVLMTSTLARRLQMVSTSSAR